MDEPLSSPQTDRTSTDFVSDFEDTDRPSVPLTIATPRPRAIELEDDTVPFLRSDVDPHRQRQTRLDMPSREEFIRELKHELSETYPAHVKAEGWEKTANIVKTYSDEMVDRWNKEIDALLTYAGLFSAVLTAFNVQSYQLLQPPSTDQTVFVLSQISAQLASFSVNSSFVNSTQPAFDPSAPFPSFQTPLYAVWLNICWFSSLVFSLAAASVGIMVKQWLNNYNVGLSGTSREIAALRQHRLNSLHKWKVPTIVAMLPVLLQIALVLFLIGLIILLWSIHVTVAVVVAVIVALLLAFTFCTTILPAVWEDCCYLSPQASGVFLVREKIRWVGQRVLEKLTEHGQEWFYLWSFRIASPLLRRLCFKIRDHLNTLHLRLSYIGPSTWRAREQVLVTHRSTALEGDMMASAYRTTMDSGCFDAAAACLVDHDYLAAIKYHNNVLQVLSGHWGNREFWPIGALDSYVQLANRVLQGTLTAIPPYGWEETTKLLALTRHLSPEVFESIDLHGFMRSCSVLAMGYQYVNKEAFYFLFRTLEPRSSWSRPCRWRTLWFVAAAAAYKVEAFRRPRLMNEHDLELALDDYSDAVRLAIRCLARPVVDTTSDSEMRAVQECVRALLASFLRFLQTPLWIRLCREEGASTTYRAIVEDIQHLSRFAHSRCFVTDEFLDALLDGLSIVAETDVDGDASDEVYDKRMDDVLVCNVLIGALQVH